jgi:ATPase involved in DNA repair/ATPase family associated with various cellular activities (AAA)
VTQEVTAAPPQPAGLDAGTYEVLRARLAGQAAELARRAEELNAARLATFGSTELRLVGTERIRTEHNCVPRDIVSIGDGLMLLGYNVFIGLKPETTVDDVFALRRFARDGDSFRFDEVAGAGADLLRDPAFARDFEELYRYYRDTRLVQLRRLDTRLLAVFQTGQRSDDIRVLRWQAGPDRVVRYLDNRGERDHAFPPPHDVEWVQTTREDHVPGRYPHISIGGEVFVETTGGDLTIKVENNTETGEGIYAEPVGEPLQSLADAEVWYARVGPLILLRIRPYKETARRYLVFNTRTRSVLRLDGIGQACQRLPEDHGIIFPGGYYLATGVARTFDTDVTDLEFERVIRSENGEDVLYVFHARGDGRSLLLPYNVIRKQVATPLPCHGHSLFGDGTLVLFQALSQEPSRVHTMQIWQTPYRSDAYLASQPAGAGPLARIGNAELVRGISDCLSVSRMVEEMSPSGPVFEAIIAACARVFDHYHWLGERGLGDLRSPLADLRGTAGLVLDEFENVRALTEQAAATLAEAAGRIGSLARLARGEAPATTDGWVARIAGLRGEQGHLVSLRELRYLDTARVDELSALLDEALADTARRAVEFLGRGDAFAGYHAEVERLVAEAGTVRTAAAAGPVGERLAELAAALQVVVDVMGGLDIADATLRVALLERIGEVLAGVNRARAILDRHRTQLLGVEGRAAFAAESALLGQAVTGALAVADTPQRCDEELGRLLLQVENLQARFAGFDDFLAALDATRAEVYEAFSARKQALLDERVRRADRLVDSAGRILAGVARRCAGLASLDEVNTYFATDPMVTKLRGIVEELRAAGDQVRAGEVEGRVKAARLEAGRALRDRLDLYADGGETIRLGRHRFAVNTQPFELTLVPHQGGLAFAITGTDYHAPVRDEVILAAREFWDQPLVSESPAVYRAEHLAATILAAAQAGTPVVAGSPALGLDRLRAAEVTPDGLPELVRQIAAGRYDEGYERGVHDRDAAAILGTLLRLHTGAGLLRYPPAARAAAQLLWVFGTDEHRRAAWTRRAGSLDRARRMFARPAALDELRAELAAAVGDFLRGAGLPAAAPDPAAGPDPAADLDLAGEYLVEELSAAPFGFVTSAGARLLLERFRQALGGPGSRSSHEFDADLRALDGDLAARYQLVAAWLAAFVAAPAPGPDAGAGAGATGPGAGPDAAGDPADLPEAIAIELCGAGLPRHDSSAARTATVDGLLGSHPRIAGRRLPLRLDETLARTRHFAQVRAPAYRAYQRHRAELAARERDRLRLEEYRPRVLSTFVRNRLLDEVYLPLIGENLARQLGAAGDARRTDHMGLLLLISPPGYGKTTLMEYVASRLGLVFVKVNGPALGHAVTSIDPDEAPNAAARQEVEKVTFALEMGSNVLLYLDDIQHTSPEFLQKFIPLCDAQRRMEGVWQGRTRGYDLRGKRFAVCMAGNPYTESGGRFQVPDMLANRADVWNLGDVLSGRDELFALSYIENALTANPVLAPLSTRERSDVDLLVRLAGGDARVRPDRLAHPYPAAELEQILSVLRKLLHIQRVVLANNRAYVASAAQAQASRTEPPYLLQGSYRDMNRLAERVVPVMNDDEVEALIDDHYQAEAQTLTSGAEANLLKFAELRGRLTGDRAARWAEVTAAYRRARALGGEGEDAVGRAVGAVGLLADQVGEVGLAIERATDRLAGGG